MIFQKQMASKTRAILGARFVARSTLLDSVYQAKGSRPRWYACSAAGRQNRQELPHVARYKPTSSPSLASSIDFWKCRSTWRRAAVNTTRCLVGCTIGDFSAMWSLQIFYPELGTSSIMAISSEPLILDKSHAPIVVLTASSG